MDLPYLPEEGVIEVGSFLVACEVCDLPIPLHVNAFYGIDDEDDECIFTEISTLDLEMHLLSHQDIASEEVPEDG